MHLLLINLVTKDKPYTFNFLHAASLHIFPVKWYIVEWKEKYGVLQNLVEHFSLILDQDGWMKINWKKSYPIDQCRVIISLYSLSVAFLTLQYLLNENN